MTKEEPTIGCSDIDRMPDPHGAVRVMDTIRANEVIQALKQRTFILLEVQEGDCLLDVGCGSGDDVQSLAETVGTSGRVVGVDNSETMIAEARKRAQGLNLPVEYHVGDAHQLDFANNTFDGCRSERLFQHVDNPRQVLGEMIRVARPGARLVVLDTDWETFVIDAPERTVTRKVLNCFCDSLRNGWIGRQLPALFYENKLMDIDVFTGTVTGTDYRRLFDGLGLLKIVQYLQETGVVSEREVIAWTDSLKEASRTGRFFNAVTMFGVSGRKP